MLWQAVGADSPSRARPAPAPSLDMSSRRKGVKWCDQPGDSCDEQRT